MNHEKRFRIKVLGIHVVLLLPHLLQLRLVARIVNRFVFIVERLLLLLLFLERFAIGFGKMAQFLLLFEFFLHFICLQ